MGVPEGEGPRSYGTLVGVPEGEEPRSYGTLVGVPEGEEPRSYGTLVGVPEGEEPRSGHETIAGHPVGHYCVSTQACNNANTTAPVEYQC